MRRVAFVVAALLATFVVVTPASAASATSWRATIAGARLHGGATTLIQSDGSGSINVKLSGVTPGEKPLVLVNPLACPEEAQDLFGFELSAASQAGVSTGRHALSAREVTAYNAALTMRLPLSLLVVTTDDKGCGNQVGSPSVGTGRLRASVADVYSYDLRYLVVGGIDATTAALVNSVLLGDAQAKAAVIVDAAKGVKPGSEPPIADDTQTFSVSLNQGGILSLAERYVANLAPDTTDTFSTFTFDLRTGEQITLARLFRPGSGYLDVLAKESGRLMTASGRGFAADVLATPQADHFAAWQLVPSGIRITFGQLQAFSVPTFSIVVPWSRLRSVLDFSSPVAALFGSGPCVASQLAATISNWEGGVGSRFTRVHLTNWSHSPCFLQGTPQSQVIDATGRVLLDSARGGAPGLAHVSAGDPVVTLAAGAAARIDVTTNNYCGPAPVGSVRVALRLPGGGTARVISSPADDPTLDDLPPCNGPVAPGVILTSGWHHA